jgi:hypothetical protein
VQRLRQSTVLQSPAMDPAAAPFAFAVWVGTIGGSALSTDPDPNVTPPSAGRILTWTPKRKASMTIGQAVLRILCGVVAASTATFQIWIFDNVKNLWVQLSGVVVITPTGAATNTNFGTNLGNRMGMKVFVQLTANTLVQAFGYDCV